MCYIELAEIVRNVYMCGCTHCSVDAVVLVLFTIQLLLLE